MPTYGVTADGFIPKTLSVIRDEMNQALRDAFGASLQLGDEDTFGQIVGILAEREALQWEQQEQVYSARDPEKATGAALDEVSLITGTFRPPATKSTVSLTLTGDDTTPVPAGSVASATSVSSIRFDTLVDATLAAIPVWVASTPYGVGDAVSNAGNCYRALTSGTSGATGPTHTTRGDVIPTDGSVDWLWLGGGAAIASVDAACEVAGPTQSFAYDVENIETPVLGWDDVVNELDATAGRDLATDAELRELRILELAGSGNSTIDSIRAALLKLVDVLAVDVFVNDGDTTNSDGMPPHSVEALVRSVSGATDDQDIADALLANVAAGIRTTGSTTASSTDSQNVAHEIKFSRPEEILIYVIVEVTKDPATYPADGDDQIKESIVTYGDAQSTGRDATASALSSRAFFVDGVLDVTSVKLGTAPAPAGSATVAVSTRQLAVYDTSRISVVSVDGTP